jgi:hypothetical protein
MVKPMLAFVQWYSPRFSAMSLVLRRQAEFEADEVGAQASSKQAMALGLVRMGVDGATLLKDHYSALHGAARESELPPQSYLRGLMSVSAAPVSERRDALVRTLRSETVYEDSHPSIRERTEAMGIAANPDDPEAVDALMVMLGKVETSAAQVFFGDRLVPILEEFDRKWATEVQEAWKAQHAEYKDSAATLAKFEGRDPASLDESETVALVEAYGNWHGTKSATDTAVAAAKRFPTSAKLQFLAGYCLLERDDESGIPMLEQAAELDRKYRASVHEAIAGFWSDRGESRAARAAAIEASNQHEANQVAYERIITVQRADQLLAFGGKAEELSRIVSQLPQLKRITAAYAFRKHDQTVPDIFLDMVFLVAKLPTFVSDQNDFIANETNRAYELLGETNGVFVQITVPKLEAAKTLAQRPDLCVYSASGSP